jgi:hypothetical protein
MKKDITTLFCFVDEFCKAVDKTMKTKLLSNNTDRKPTREPGLSMSEMVTITILFQQSPCKNFKYFYKSYLQQYRSEFKELPSYSRFIWLKKRTLPYLILLMEYFCLCAKQTGNSYIDSSSIAVCHNKRISRNKVFKGIAKLGKTTKGWFFGFKLHLIINEQGEIQNVRVTQGNVDDRVPVPSMIKKLKGLLFGDKGYIKKELFDELYKNGLKLVTGIKSQMKNILMPLSEKILLRKRSIIETVFGQLKNIFQLEHSRHRSIWNFMVNLLTTLIAYSLKPSKPSIKYPSLIQN